MSLRHYSAVNERIYINNYNENDMDNCRHILMLLYICTGGQLKNGFEIDVTIQQPMQ